ncbi:MAG: hypothetical protein OXG37_11855 [Actinomycetia bacterium]|nr:hypothetical protein [Actinomycetes bacterium]
MPASQVGEAGAREASLSAHLGAHQGAGGRSAAAAAEQPELRHPDRLSTAWRVDRLEVFGRSGYDLGSFDVNDGPGVVWRSPDGQRVLIGYGGRVAIPTRSLEGSITVAVTLRLHPNNSPSSDDLTAWGVELAVTELVTVDAIGVFA